MIFLGSTIAIAQTPSKACGEAKSCLEDEIIEACAKDAPKARAYEKCLKTSKESQAYAHSLEGVIQEKERQSEKDKNELKAERVKTFSAQMLANERGKALKSIFRSPFFWFGIGVLSAVGGYGLIKVFDK